MHQSKLDHVHSRTMRVNSLSIQHDVSLRYCALRVVLWHAPWSIWISLHQIAVSISLDACCLKQWVPYWLTINQSASSTCYRCCCCCCCCCCCAWLTCSICCCVFSSGLLLFAPLFALLWKGSGRRNIGSAVGCFWQPEARKAFALNPLVDQNLPQARSNARQ
jgi:hypothetical protein